MNWTAWLKWLIAPLAAAVLLVAVWAVLALAGMETFGSVTFRVLAGLAGAVTAGAGLATLLRITDGDSPPAKWAQSAATTLVLFAGAIGLSVAFTGQAPLFNLRASWPPALDVETYGALDTHFLRASVGVILVAWVFAIALGLARLALRLGTGPMGVARTVLDEAIRMKVAVVFIALLLLILPILPFVLDAGDPLRYRVQTFLSYSIAATGFLLSMMTIFLACGTLSREIDGKQIFTTAVKPIGRTSYLFGKWLGIVALNGVLLGVAAVAIYGFTMFYLAQLPPNSAEDAAALREEVLTARIAEPARPAVSREQWVETRVRQMMEENPLGLRNMGETAAERLGLTGASDEVLMQLAQQEAREQFALDFNSRWLSVGPNQQSVYYFEGLGHLRREWDRVYQPWVREAQAAQEAGRRVPPPPAVRYVQLRYHIETNALLPENQIDVELALNRNRMVQRLVVEDAQVLPIPVHYIDEDGRLELIIHNPPQNPTLTFTPDRGLEVLHSAGAFGPNFLRGFLVIWLKLGFLAILGLAAATFLGFPVACMLALLVFFAATASPFLLTAVSAFQIEEGPVGIVQWLIRFFGLGIAMALERFAEFNPGPQIVDGRFFGWDQVLRCVLWIGGLWSLVAGVVGAAVFRSRELARVQV